MTNPEPAAPLRSKTKSLFEVTLGALLALAFFMVLLGVLNVIFPGASTIGALVRDRTSEGARGSGDLNLDGLGAHEGIAMLLDVERSVRDKPSGSVIWNQAGEGKALADHHAVQTLRHSSATIAFDDQNRIDLGADSLIVVRRPNRLDTAWERRAAVEFVGGTLTGSLDRGDADARQVELHAAGRTIRAAKGSENTTTFDLREDASGGAILSVRGGDAEMTDKNGMITIPADHVVRFDETTVDRARPLPLAPRRLSPPRGSRFVYRETPQPVEFAWKQRVREQPHRLQIADDAAFDDLVLDVTTSEPRFVHGNLRAGEYHWRVSALVEGVEGAPSATGRFSVYQDLDPPSLAIDAADAMPGRKLELRGSTEPGASVFVGDLAVPLAADGSFEQTVPLRRGLNFVVIQAVDSAGNTTFRTREILTGAVIGRRSQ